MEKGKIVLLNDEKKVSESLKAILKDDSYNVTYMDSIESINEISREEKPKGIIIDLTQYGDEGFDLCRKLKDNFETRRAAIVLYTESADEELIIKGLEAGADEFLSNKFTERETSARVKAIIRRIETSSSKKIKVKDLEIDLDEHKVKKAGKPIDLTYIQFKLLYLLASRRDNVFSRKEILERVWGRKVYVTNRTVDVHIKRLREKLGEYKYPSQYIETIHGTGYRFL
ncbi:response regulator transcription factor [candidate division KSB1 bacterium]|nr:response regulator transcription factor [candidate division KSB1 bacterium]